MIAKTGRNPSGWGTAEPPCDRYGSEFVIWLFKISGNDVLKRWVKQVSKYD